MSHDHPYPVKATQQQVANHPELRHGTRMGSGSKWMSSMTNMLACCPESVCELVDRTASYQWPVVHPPGHDCPTHPTPKCPRCGAKGWELCRTPAGHLTTKAHKARMFDAGDGERLYGKDTK